MLAFPALLFVSILAPLLEDPADGASEQEDPLTEAIEELRQSRFADRSGGFFGANPYFQPMHGWPDKGLVTLMGAREVATALVCEEIEWLDERQAAGDEPNQNYREVLYYVLGMVKDPASIAWLEERLETHRSDVFEFWLPKWRRWPGGPDASERVWLKDPGEWGRYLREVFEAAEEEDEFLPALTALSHWSFEPETARLLEETRERPDLPPKVVALVEYHLQQRGLRVDSERLVAAIDAITHLEEGEDWLHGQARAMRHEAFVPWLISIVEEPWEGGWSARLALEEITLESGIERHEWKVWWGKHSGETRADWVDAYFDALLRQYETDPSGAAARFASDRYAKGDDLLFARSIHRVAELPEMHEALGFLIKWNEHPTIRAELQMAVDAINRSGGRCAPLVDSGGPGGPDFEATAGRVWLDDLPYAKGF